MLSGAILEVWIWFGQDFVCYYAWTKLVLTGNNPYDYNLVVATVLETIGRGGNCPLYYPLWFVFPLLPLATIDFQISRLIWISIMLAFWLIAVKLHARQNVRQIQLQL